MHKDSEIAKLTERISKDPKSKLFVPLAEEYKKAGDIEMSILVLQEGLKNNPAYVTARSFLGRLLIEKGDLPGAQKEFEEVIKAIPDNLMAHKKLGDIYALQGRPADALTRYKTVVSLNPKDAESALLIAEIEAGRDIKKHLFQPRSPAAAEQQKQQESVSTPAGPPAASVSSPRQAVMSAEEEPEEVLVVEPLDPPGEPASLEQQLAQNGMEFLSETAQEGSPPGAEDSFAGADPFTIDGPARANDASGAPPEQGENPEKQADDFTTDTLAELYISQGFYEKAIDIYERMLVDKPNSQGLKDKLQKVRSMAASAGRETDPETAASEVPGGLDPGFEAGETPGSGGSRVFDSFVPPAAGSELPPLDDWGAAPAGPAPAIDTPPVQSRPQHFDVGFEPKEYVPPDAVMRKQAEQKTAEAKADADRPAARQIGEEKTGKPKNGPTSKKETIERLEGWLRSITKEN